MSLPSVPVNGCAWFHGRKVALSRVNVPEHELPKDPERARLFEELNELQVRQLRQWDGDSGVNFGLPESAFANDPDCLVSVADLVTRPVPNDLAEVARDEDGNEKRLESEMVGELRREGRFSVPSRAFPPMKHVWQLPSWLQRGTANIDGVFRSWISFALDQVVVYLPDRLWKPVPVSGPTLVDEEDRFNFHPNFVNAFRSIARACRRIVDLLVGLPVTTACYNEEKLVREFEDQQLSFLIHEAADDVDTRFYKEPGISAALYSMYVSGDGLSRTRGEGFFYLCAILGHDVENMFSCGLFYDQPGDGHSNAGQRSAAERKRIMHSALDTSAEFARLGNEAKEAVRNALQAYYTRTDHLAQMCEKLNEREQEIAKHVSDERGGMGPEWQRRETVRRMRRVGRAEGGDATERESRSEESACRVGYFSSATVADLRNEVVSKLERDGNIHEAALERLRIQFLYDIWPAREAALLKATKREPLTRERLDYVDGVWKRRKVKMGTWYPGWRLVACARDSWRFIRASMHWLLLANVRGGPLGLRALVGRKQFDIFGGRAKRHTLVSRVGAIWKDVAAKRAEFEEAEDSGLLSKAATRWLHKLWHYVLRGGLSTALVVVGQPTLTALNVCLSAVMVAATPVWVVGVSVLNWVSSLLLFDRYGLIPERWTVRSYDVRPELETRYTIQEGDASGSILFPIVSEGVRILVNGCGQAVAAGCGTILAHPGLAIGASAIASVRFVFGSLRDFIFRRLIVRLGRIPVSDSFLAKRIAGPGISSTYYYRISPEVVSKVLRAALERVELDMVVHAIIVAISEPENDFRVWCRDTTLHIIGLEHGRDSAIDSQMYTSYEARNLIERGDRLRKSVRDAAKSRAKWFSALLRMPEDADRLRPELSADETLFNACNEVRVFYESRLQPFEKDDDEESKVWSEFNLGHGDVALLTRRLLEVSFHQNFLQPLHESDEILQIPVKFDSALHVPGWKEERERMAEMWVESDNP